MVGMSQEILNGDMIEKRVDLYVASPELFWKIVNKEAERIARNFPKK